MRFDATRSLQSAIWRNCGGFVPALFLILAALLVAARPAPAAGPQAQPPAAKQPRNARPAANQTAPPNATAAQTASPEVVPLAPQDLPQDPLQSAIQNGIQKGTQEEKPYPAATQATQTSPGNAAPSTSPDANATSSEPPAVNGATNPNQPAAATLVCKGTRNNGAAFTFPFEANTGPAPTAGDACVPSGKKMPKGTAVMGTAPKASTVFAVVLVPPSTAGGANTGAAGPAAATLVCKGTRANGAAFTFPFEANTSPAPTAGDACVPSGKKMPKGTAVVGTAPKAAKVFAVVFVPPSTPSTTPKGSADTNPPSNTTPNAQKQPKPKQPAAAPTGPVPPAINAGIKAMVSSKASLEIAGNKWGGHKEPAIKLIDQALTACGQTATADNAGTKSNPAGDTAAMEAALTQLTAAQKDFTSAKNPYGECRDKAKDLINQALSDVQAGIAYAKSHNTY
jgi:hypothetical protein